VTDFAGSLKPTRLPLDDPSDFSFFFDTSGRRICYVAPERFYKAERETRKAWTDEESERKEPAVTEAMDVFSAGCVIAEVFLEGASLFSLSQLFKYREGEYSVEAQLLAIGDEGIRVSDNLMLVFFESSHVFYDLVNDQTDDFIGRCCPTKLCHAPGKCTRDRVARVFLFILARVRGFCWRAPFYVPFSLVITFHVKCPSLHPFLSSHSHYNNEDAK